MKKLKCYAIILGVVSIIGLTFLMSCQKKEIPTSPDLLENLKQFNTTYQANHFSNSSESSSKGFWSALGDALIVAGADIVGAGAGVVLVKEAAAVAGLATGGTGAAVVAGTAAVISGGGASVAASRALKSGTSLSFGNLNINYPQDYTHLSNCGINHNIEVYNIMTKGSSYFCNNSNAKSENDEIFNSEEWNLFMDELLQLIGEYRQNENIDDLIVSLKMESKISPKMANVFELFFEIFNQIREDKNVEEIVEFYMNTIATSDYLDSTEKEALVASFSVASESIYYWLNLCDVE